jgi:hypothetical protein
MKPCRRIGCATLTVLQATLGHANISTTSAYLHARPTAQAGCASIQGCFFDEDEET